jgi:ribonuclease HII
MGIVIGMDEAGYGPNLGPLVVTATVWEVAGSPSRIDFWKSFADCVTSVPLRRDSRLHVADSKQVYKSRAGLAALERGVSAALRLMSFAPASFNDLCVQLCGNSPLGDEPWFADTNLPLPKSSTIIDEEFEQAILRWLECCEASGIRLKAVRCDVVLTRRFNAMIRECGSKGIALSRISMKLLRDVWDPAEVDPTLVLADKHGGRNRYDDLLSEVTDGAMIFRLTEGTDISRYRVGSTEIRFQARAEEHLPVALASMFSKYVRELSMILFNEYWRRHIPDLKPTQGYPVDARRFREDIAAVQTQIGMSDDDLWRER